VSTAALLAGSGVTLSSILLYPLRRRLPGGENRLQLRSGVSLAAPADEPLLFLFREIWAEDCYGSRDLALAPGEAVVDIGAHVGVFVAQVATRYPHARVIAVEPSPRARGYLRRNVAANRLNNVRIVASACGGERRRAVLQVRHPEMMSTLYGDDGAAEPVSVDVQTLEQLFDEHNVERCGLIKLDCEGAEYEIFRGASPGTLQRIQRIAMEAHIGTSAGDPDELAGLLRAAGFVVKAIPSVDGRHVYIFAHRPAN
jgi:FkbM family methyltransferase